MTDETIGNNDKQVDVAATTVSSKVDELTENLDGYDNPQLHDDKEYSSSSSSSSCSELLVVSTVIQIHPPISTSENIRDVILRTLDHPIVQGLGLFVLFLVIVDGALFFFLLMGWHTLCTDSTTPSGSSSRTDCEPRNWWYNFSIQVLNVLFTYMNLVSLPWRCVNFLHVAGWTCPYRNHNVGYDLYGLQTPHDIWFHLPLRTRLYITVLLLFSAIFQFINQGTRIVYYEYESQDETPGNIWTNVFFASSFLCAAWAGIWMGISTTKVRNQSNPGQFGPSPIDAIKEQWKNRKQRKQQTKNEEVEEDKQQEQPNHVENDTEEKGESTPDSSPRSLTDTAFPDPTRTKSRQTVLPLGRPEMRMFAM